MVPCSDRGCVDLEQRVLARVDRAHILCTADLTFSDGVVVVHEPVSTDPHRGVHRQRLVLEAHLQGPRAVPPGELRVVRRDAVLAVERHRAARLHGGLDEEVSPPVHARVVASIAHEFPGARGERVEPREQ